MMLPSLSATADQHRRLSNQEGDHLAEHDMDASIIIIASR
jgi:hypothetical protein